MPRKEAMHFLQQLTRQGNRRAAIVEILPTQVRISSCCLHLEDGIRDCQNGDLSTGAMLLLCATSPKPLSKCGKAASKVPPPISKTRMLVSLALEHMYMHQLQTRMEQLILIYYSPKKYGLMMARVIAWWNRESCVGGTCPRCRVELAPYGGQHHGSSGKDDAGRGGRVFPPQILSYKKKCNILPALSRFGERQPQQQLRWELNAEHSHRGCHVGTIWRPASWLFQPRRCKPLWAPAALPPTAQFVETKSNSCLNMFHNNSCDGN